MPDISLSEHSGVNAHKKTALEYRAVSAGEVFYGLWVKSIGIT